MKKLLFLLGFLGMMSCQPQEPTLQYYLDYTRNLSTYYNEGGRGIEVTGKITNTNEETRYKLTPVIKIWLKGQKEEYSINEGTMAEVLVKMRYQERFDFVSYTQAIGEREYIGPGEKLLFVARSDYLPDDVEEVNMRLEWEEG